jgi:hypothetical protein
MWWTLRRAAPSPFRSCSALAPGRLVFGPVFDTLGRRGHAIALDTVPRAVGTGSAVLGAAQFGLAALISPVVGLGNGHSAVPMAITIATCRRRSPYTDARQISTNATEG